MAIRTGTWRRLLVAAAVCVGLNAALTMRNAWPSLRVEAGPGLSVELLVVVAVVAIALERRGRVAGGLLWLLAGALFLLIAGRYFAVTAHALFGRSINLYFDLPHVPAVIAMTAAALPTAKVVLLAALVIVVPAVLFLAIRWAVGRLALSFVDGTVRRTALAVSVMGIAGYAAGGLFGAQWTSRVFALPVSPVYAQQAAFVADALAERKEPDALSNPVVPADPTALGGSDVFVFFLESYGEVAYGVPEISQAVRPRIAQAERRLAGRGWHMASGFFTSPTFGGGSWLAHSSFLTGVPVSRNRDYQLLLSSSRPSLVGRFEKAGYRTVALMPGLKLAWPEGRFYGFDKIYDAAALGYDGKPFGWWTIPDQFTVARMAGAEADAAGRRPLFVVFPTVMSHMPFAPVPPYLADWSRAADPAAYGEAANRRAAGFGDWRAARGAYRAAILYDIDLVEGFLAERAPPGSLVLVLGDHQPPGVVSGPDAGWLVPVHVFSRDEGRIARFLAEGFRPGLTPKGASLGDFAALHNMFAAGLR